MRLLIGLAGLGLAAGAASAQLASPSAADGMVLGARRVGPTTPLSIYNRLGSLRIVGWNRDSVEIRGKFKPPSFFFVGTSAGMKLGYDGMAMKMGVADTVGPGNVNYALVVYVPRQSQLSVTTNAGDIDATDVSGTFHSSAGAIQLHGTASTLDVDAIAGSIDIDATASWVRARTGQGRLLIRGAVQDVDGSTIDGMLDVASPAIFRGRFSSVTGDIRYAGSPASGSLFEFSNHSGAVDFLLPRTVSSVFELSSVTGVIENGFTQVAPAAAGAHSLRLNLGRGGAQVTVRTFKGPIRLRPQP